MEKPISKKPVLLSKGIFFCFFAAASVFMPFLAVYYEQHGLTGGQIGLLSMIPPIMAMVGTSIWGALSDATQRHKQLFILAIAGSILSVILIPTSAGFLGVGLIVALHAFCFMSLFPLLDNTALGVLGEQSHKYGQIRLWGSIGWGVGAPLIGPLVESFGLEWTFYSHAALMGAALLIATGLPIAKSSGGNNFVSGLRQLLKDQRWFLFLLIIFIAGFGDAIPRNYSFLYLKGLGASSLLMGLSLTVGMISELVVLSFSGQLLRWFGPRRLLVLSVLAQAGRLLGWSLIDEPYLAISLQLLNGLTFGAMWIAGVAYANEIAPAGMGATAQGLLSGVYFGLSSMAGGLLGGIWYEQGGPGLMYGWGAGILLAGLILFSLASSLSLRGATKQPVELSEAGQGG